VEDLAKSGYKFYKFLREYRERYCIHNDDACVQGIGNFTAVLDGQQRLTSLYLGLKGSYAYKNTGSVGKTMSEASQPVTSTSISHASWKTRKTVASMSFRFSRIANGQCRPLREDVVPRRKNP